MYRERTDLGCIVQKYKWLLIALFSLSHFALTIYAAFIASGIGFSRHAVGGDYSFPERVIFGITYLIYFPLGDIAVALPRASDWSLVLLMGNSLLWGTGLYHGSLILESWWAGRQHSRERLPISMTVRKALIAVFGCSLTCGIGGALIGYSIGRFLPGAYRSMFAPAEPGFSPTAVGIGLGLPQGLFFGAVVGIAVVGIVTWYEVRIAEANRRVRIP
jgi:hypothetical protein